MPPELTLSQPTVEPSAEPSAEPSDELASPPSDEEIVLSPEENWEFPQPPTDLIYDDGVPLESNRHRIAMNVLIDSSLTLLKDQPNTFAGGNMFVYYSSKQVKNQDFRGPDFFVALDVEHDHDRKTWTVWEENGRYPDAIVELMSPSTTRVDLNEKKHIYERIFRTTSYFVYNPFIPNSFQGWQLDNAQRYQPLTPNENAWLWCEPLGVWFGLWEGQLRKEPGKGTCQWLRMFDTEGKLILLQEEFSAIERNRAEEERNRAEEERQRADDAQQKAERLAARLRELGEDPDNV
jgi:Uma2 family endonuclease